MTGSANSGGGWGVFESRMNAGREKNAEKAMSDYDCLLRLVKIFY